jgi:hypothetical protein
LPPHARKSAPRVGTPVTRQGIRAARQEIGAACQESRATMCLAVQHAVPVVQLASERAPHARRVPPQARTLAPQVLPVPPHARKAPPHARNLVPRAENEPQPLLPGLKPVWTGLETRDLRQKRSFSAIFPFPGRLRLTICRLPLGQDWFHSQAGRALVKKIKKMWRPCNVLTSCRY